MYCGMQKGTSWAEATSNNEKIKPVVLAIIKLCLSEGISQLVTQLDSRKFHLIIFKKVHSNLCRQGRISGLLVDGLIMLAKCFFC